MRKLFYVVVLLSLLMLAACDRDTVSEQPTPTPTVEVTVTPDCAEPTPVPTATPEPTPTWSEEPAEITFQLEGESHTVMGFRYTSPLGYSMIYDPDWVRPEQHAGYDHYTAVTEIHIPELYMQVTKTDKTAEQVIGELKAQGAEENAIWLIGGYRSVGLTEMSGFGPADVAVNYYVTQVGESVYLLETSYFWEAAEGFGARMLQMLNTIQFAEGTEAAELKLLFRDKEIKDFTSAIGESTYVTVCAEAGAYLESPVWTTDNEDVCELYTDDIGCYIEIKSEGFAKVTAKCGDLEQSVIVRAINSW